MILWSLRKTGLIFVKTIYDYEINLNKWNVQTKLIMIEIKYFNFAKFLMGDFMHVNRTVVKRDITVPATWGRDNETAITRFPPRKG